VMPPCESCPFIGSRVQLVQHPLQYGHLGKLGGTLLLEVVKPLGATGRR
jgi:hypothetical protein